MIVSSSGRTCFFSRAPSEISSVRNSSATPTKLACARQRRGAQSHAMFACSRHRQGGQGGGGEGWVCLDSAVGEEVLLVCLEVLRVAPGRARQPKTVSAVRASSCNGSKLVAHAHRRTHRAQGTRHARAASGCCHVVLTGMTGRSPSPSGTPCRTRPGDSGEQSQRRQLRLPHLTAAQCCPAQPARRRAKSVMKEAMSPCPCAE